MSDLSPETRALIDMARDADGPTHDDRARIRSAVTRRLAMGAAAGITATAAAKTATAGIALKLVVSAALLTVAAVVTVKPETVAPPLPPPPVVQKVVPRARPAPAAVPKAARPPAPAPEKTVEAPLPPPPKPSAKPAPAPVDPSEEIRAVREAHAALKSGNGDAALRILEQQSKKPGILAEERAAARVLALCAAGRAKEARAEAGRFLAIYPRSPQATRVSSACAEIESDNPF